MHNPRYLNHKNTSLLTRNDLMILKYEFNLQAEFLPNLTKRQEKLQQQSKVNEINEENAMVKDTKAEYTDSPGHIAKTMTFSIDNILQKFTRQSQT
ncbi:forkhead box protein i1-ema-like protein [Lasius niger]|uniref:Forkhead box protein i1-ema-like protein n=1 Tax=Lasius niger TaxID=67767 RepID=A0A0J7NK32_LASNI|nr:forkhead box protein i1-ema-like protein [Lasius niger]KMQ92845.1 forkhead box protein i1-ema-like protein [Lasius niger]